MIYKYDLRQRLKYVSKKPIVTTFDIEYLRTLTRDLMRQHLEFQNKGLYKHSAYPVFSEEKLLS